MERKSFAKQWKRDWQKELSGLDAADLTAALERMCESCPPPNGDAATALLIRRGWSCVGRNKWRSPYTSIIHYRQKAMAIERRRDTMAVRFAYRPDSRDEMAAPAASRNTRIAARLREEIVRHAVVSASEPSENNLKKLLKAAKALVVVEDRLRCGE